jgi:hypothetical protein
LPWRRQADSHADKFSLARQPVTIFKAQAVAVEKGFMVKLLGTGAAKPKAQPAVAGKPVRDNGTQVPEAGNSRPARAKSFI